MTDRPRAAPTARAIKAILGIQVAIAAVLFGQDMLGTLPSLGFTPRAPSLDQPVRPGDQTRRFDPSTWPTRPRLPGTPVPDTPDMPSRLQFEPDPAIPGLLRLTGTIAPGDAQRFTDWLSSTTVGVVKVTLHSPGGSVSDALEIGRALRAHGAATEIQAHDICLSACPYILAGGKTRHVADNGYVGVHQHYFDENTMLPAFLAVEDIQRGQGAVLTYLIEMEIDPAVMQHALVTPPAEIYILTQEELAEYKLISQE